MLSVSNLSVWYGVTEVLRDVTFEVPEGKVVALLGGNGSGKTTILNTLTGLIRPRGGSISIAGEEIAGRPPDRIVKLGMAQVPQGREVFASMTVEENIDLGAVTRRDRKVVASDKVEIFTLFPALAKHRHKRAGSLSGGEQQQVAIGRALMCRPRLLLMDEPSAGLAPVVVQQVFALIRRIRAEGFTVLIVEQNVKQMLDLVDRAYLLDVGAIRISGTAAELKGNEFVRRAYLGL